MVKLEREKRMKEGEICRVLANSTLSLRKALFDWDVYGFWGIHLAKVRCSRMHGRIDTCILQMCKGNDYPNRAEVGTTPSPRQLI